MTDRDRTDGGVVLGDAERRAQLRLIEHAEENGAEPRIDGGEQDVERGHARVYVPIRDRPALLTAVGHPLSGMAYLVRYWSLLDRHTMITGALNMSGQPKSLRRSVGQVASQ